MRTVHGCDHCGDLVGALEIGVLDEEALGLSSLTLGERAHIIRFDRERGLMPVGSACDDCLIDLGFDKLGLADGIPLPRPVIH